MFPKGSSQPYNNNNNNILGISETWLLPNVPSSYVDLPNYVFVRKDVEGLVYKHGVGLYILCKLCFTEVDTHTPNTLPIFLPALNLYVLIVYRPPSYTANENACLLNFLSDFCSGKEIVIMGDFNLPSIQWANDTPCRGFPPIELQFYHCFMALGLTHG